MQTRPLLFSLFVGLAITVTGGTLAYYDAASLGLMLVGVMISALGAISFHNYHQQQQSRQLLPAKINAQPQR